MYCEDKLAEEKAPTVRQMSHLETWLSVALCYLGACMPLLSDVVYDMGNIIWIGMLALLVIGFVAGVSLLRRQSTEKVRGIIIPGVIICGLCLFMLVIAGTQS
jgi:hypothetical protein